MELLMSHDKAKTLELGIQDWGENIQIGFIIWVKPFLWLNEDDSNNTMGAFLGLVW
jgi:hypothetical protein